MLHQNSSVSASQSPPGDRSPKPTGEQFPAAVGGQSPIPTGGQSTRPPEERSPRPTSGWGRRRDSDAKAAYSPDHEPGRVFVPSHASDSTPVGSVDGNRTATRDSAVNWDVDVAEPPVSATNADSRLESADSDETATRDSVIYCEIDEISGTETTATATNSVPLPTKRPIPSPRTRSFPPLPQQCATSPPLQRPPIAPPSPPTRPLPPLPQQCATSPPLQRPPTVPPPPPTEQTLWCRLPAVVGSGVLQRLNDEQRRLQEALFEVISSEASYHSSLSLLQHHFQEPLLRKSSSPLCQDSPQCAISDVDYQQLFSNVDEVRQCSVAFLADLRRIQREDIMLSGICEVVHRHSASHLYPYKQYCAHKIHQDLKLKELTEQYQPFTKLLCWLESRPECKGLSLSAFLLLPLQRVTRLPLLMAAILTRLEPGHPERSSCDQACQTLTTLAQHCDEDAHREKQRQRAAATGDTNLSSDTKGRRSWRRRGVRLHSTFRDSDETTEDGESAT